jgi:type IV secretory pathway VirJ component
MHALSISGWRIACLAALLACYSITSHAGMQEETINFGNFGDVHIYRQSSLPEHVVLFISGDGGWNLGIIDMARALTDLDVLVAGIDITTYFKRLAAGKQACSYPAADFKGLSQYLQKHYDFPDLDSLRYFWSKRSPDEAGLDL